MEMITLDSLRHKAPVPRTTRCGVCAGCLRIDCNQCPNCMDRRVNGGPSIKKQACVRRACISLKSGKLMPPDAPLPPPSAALALHEPSVPPPSRPSTHPPEVLESLFMLNKQPSFEVARNPESPAFPESPLVAGGKALVLRLMRCGVCTGCLVSDCGRCKNCLDKPRYGGPGVKKQACVARQCTQSHAFSGSDGEETAVGTSPLVNPPKNPASAALAVTRRWSEAQCTLPGSVQRQSPGAVTSPLLQPPLASLDAAARRAPFKLEDDGSASTTASAPYPPYPPYSTAGATPLGYLGLLGRLPAESKHSSAMTILSFAAAASTHRREYAYAAEPAPMCALADRHSPSDLDWPASSDAERWRSGDKPHSLKTPATQRRGSSPLTSEGVGHVSARKLGGKSAAVDSEFVRRLALRPFKPDRERRRAGTKQGYYA
ncbi:hypothetical protein T492DRAFT_841478 [Pavlovales sp. CCMP2436]|nr:hypothetical protein T492DRAFT_841478 [Pavlovales sp. CCMP2436]